MSTARDRRPAKKASAAPKTAAAPKVETGADILGRIRPSRRVESTTVCLNAKLIRDFEDADAELLRLMGAAQGNSNRLNPGKSAADAVDEAEQSADPALRAQARKVRSIEQAIVDAQVEFTFTAMNKDEYAELCAMYPPRRNNQLDQIVGYHRDEVIDAMVRASLTSPTFEDCLDESGQPNRECDHSECGTWQQLVGIVNLSEWGELRDCANLANSGVNDAPKSVLASRILDRRATASK